MVIVNIKDDLSSYVTTTTTVPNLFRCPISLDIMKSPVSLCTGVTYDRVSIQRWLDNGNNTCPATMQILNNKDLIPNHNLQRLIKIWYDSSALNIKASPISNNFSMMITREQAQNIVHQMINSKEFIQEEKILMLNRFAQESDESCRFLLSVSEHILPYLFTLLGKKIKNVVIVSRVVDLTIMLLRNLKDHKFRIDHLGNDFCPSMVFYMQKGCKELRISISKLLELISSLGFKDKFMIITQNPEIYSGLLRDELSTETSLSCLISLATPRRNRVILAKANAVSVLSKLLSKQDLTISLTEKVLKLLEMESSCKEGRVQICEDLNCVEGIVKKVLKVSNVATEHGVTIIWSLCCLFRDEKAQKAVIKSCGMTKLLLLMQSNCSPTVRQMCSDLLKVFRVSSSKNNYSYCLSSYDTKTTHIMPF